MPDIVSLLWRFFSLDWMPVAMLGVLWMMYLAVSSRASSLRSGQSLSVRRPGWIARRRARAGIAHPRGRVGIGYRSAVGASHLDLASLNHHGYVGGAPGSGKTMLLRLLIQGYPGPVIALDAKGSPELAHTVWRLPGHVWEIGGPLKLDLLDPEPAILAQQLLEGEIFTDRAAVYRAIAEHAVQRAAWVLRWRAEPRDPARILEMLSSPASLAAAIRKSAPPINAMAQRWLVELDSPTATVREAFQTFSERLGTLLDSPAGRSLGSGDASIRLDDVVASGGKLLVRLDPRYGAISRKLGAWTLVAMLRLAAELRQAVERLIGEPDASGCRRWRGSYDQDGYPRAWWRGSYRKAHRLLYEWQRGEIPRGWTLDHTCRHRWCVETEHHEPVTRAEHARREAERKRQDQAAALEAPAPTQALKAAPAEWFEIALFARIDRPALERRTIDLANLVKLLTTPRELPDKHQAPSGRPPATPRARSPAATPALRSSPLSSSTWTVCRPIRSGWRRCAGSVTRPGRIGQKHRDGV